MSSADIAAKALSLTNGFRRQHGAPPLQWSQQLFVTATEYATQLTSKNCPLAPKPDVQYGQNLFQLHGLNDGKNALTDAVEQASKYWYDGHKDYKWSDRGEGGLSFSQLIWKSCERMAVGVAQSADRKRTVVIGLYEPCGNVDGQFSANVTKKMFSDVKTEETSRTDQGQQQRRLNDTDIGINQQSHGIESTNQNELFSKLNSDISESHNENSVQEQSFSSSSFFSSSTSTSTSTSTATDFTESSTSEETTESSNPSQITSGLMNIDLSSSTSSNVRNVNKATAAGAAPPSWATPAQCTAQNLHNELRLKHGVGAVQLDKKLCENAEIHAKSLLNGNKASATLGVADVGQNVYQVTGSLTANRKEAAAVEMAINKWYEHIKDYNWGSPLASNKYANLSTQIIWKGTETIGVGVATRDDLTIIVCLYSPRGNIANVEDYQNNVFPSTN